MVIGILLNSDNKLCSYSDKYRKILSWNGISYVIIDPNSDTLFDDLKECSHLLFHHTQGDTDMLIYDAIFNIAQNIYNIKCFPNYETYWPYENKVKEYYLLKNCNFPIVDYRIFWNYEPAVLFLKKAEYPIVAKLPKGAGSRNVVKVNSFREGEQIIKQVFGKGVRTSGLKSRSNLSSLSKTGFYGYARKLLKSCLIRFGLIRDKTDYPEWQIQKDAIIFQKYLHGNTFDTRVTVIGNRAIAFRRFVREGDFRASGSGNFDTDPGKIDIRCIKIAMDISRQMNFNTMAYDFIYNEEKEPFINEISYCFVDTIVQSCPGYWDEKLTWHNGHHWPQYFQLEDLLEIKNLVYQEYY